MVGIKEKKRKKHEERKTKRKKERKIDRKKERKKERNGYNEETKEKNEERKTKKKEKRKKARRNVRKKERKKESDPYQDGILYPELKIESLTIAQIHSRKFLVLYKFLLWLVIQNNMMIGKKQNLKTIAIRKNGVCVK